jgi:UDP-N-acetyl-2-amino-2-deoxyglucuronate dehydrogenase
MSKRLIKFGLIGCGNISRKHWEALSLIPQASLTALSDIDESRMRERGKKYSVKKLYNEYTDLLKDPDIDAVIICSPSGLHSRMAMEAAQFGKHVILEKPMALNTKDAKAIIGKFKRQKKSLAVVLQNRQNSAVEYLKKHSMELGKLYFASISTFWYRPQSYYDDGWHGTYSMDGGVLMNQGTHYVDMLLHIAGKKPSKVFAFSGTVAHKMEAEDVLAGSIAFSDGSLASVQANTVSYPENYEGSITLFYEKATIKIGGKAMNIIEYWKGVGEKKAAKFKAEAIKDIYGKGHFSVIKNFVDHLVNKKPLFAAGEEGLLSLEIIESMYKSARTGKVIKL